VKRAHDVASPDLTPFAGMGRSYLHDRVRESWPFRYLDDRGLALPMSRFVRLAIRSPLEAVSQLVSEHRSQHSRGRPIVVFALPKSGSTLTELVLRTNGYIDLMHSVRFRTATATIGSSASEQVQRLFRWTPPGRAAFAKVHSPFDPDFRGALAAREACGVIQVRDIRDALVSRYHHIMASPRHRHHAMLRGLSEAEGIKRSFFGAQPGSGDDAVSYFSAWIVDWVSSGHFPVLRYEDFVLDLNSSIDRLIAAMGQPPEDRERLLHAVEADRQRGSRTTLQARLGGRGRTFSTFRRGVIGSWREIFDQETIDLVKQHANRALVVAGYERDDQW